MTDTEQLSLRDIEQFLFKEARLQDEHSYTEWEQLWTDDGRYWIPAFPDTDPDTTVSIIYDNRARIASRVKQLETGYRYAQDPVSKIRRVLGNIELIGREDSDYVVEANFVLVEYALTRRELWAGRTRYHLRVTDEGIRMSFKVVNLLNQDGEMPAMGFLM